MTDVARWSAAAASTLSTHLAPNDPGEFGRKDGKQTSKRDWKQKEEGGVRCFRCLEMLKGPRVQAAADSR